MILSVVAVNMLQVLQKAILSQSNLPETSYLLALGQLKALGLTGVFVDHNETPNSSAQD